jgi:hypothetical protein
MTPTLTPTDARSRLKEVRSQMGDLRDQVARTRRDHDEAQAALVEAAERPGRITEKPEYQRKERALAAMRAAEEQLDAAQDEQHQLLTAPGIRNDRQRVGDARDGTEATKGNGWEFVARQLSEASQVSADGEVRFSGPIRVDVPAGDLLAADFKGPGEELDAPSKELPFMQKGQDTRSLYAAFPRANLEQSDLALTEFRQKGTRAVQEEARLERDPMSTSAKPKADLETELVTPTVKQFPILIEKVPAKLLEAVEPLRAFLESESRYLISLDLDLHCLEQIKEAKPAFGESGADAIAKARNAVADVKALGGNPTVYACTPAEAATLDLTKTEAAGYVYGSRDSGSASPLWGMNVVEVPSIDKPHVIDPRLSGVFYAGVGRVIVDPYSGLGKNEVRIECVIEALFHVRDVGGIHRIDKEAAKVVGPAKAAAHR